MNFKYLTYSFRYYGEHVEWLFEQCHACKNLYNQALYVIRQRCLNKQKIPSYFDLDKEMRGMRNLDGEINYKLLKATCAQLCIKQLSKNVQLYKKAHSDWIKNNKKYTGEPKFPYYKKDYNMLNYTYTGCSIKNGEIRLDKNHYIPIPLYNRFKNKIDNFKCIRIIPKCKYIKIEIVYKIKCLNYETNSNFAGVDLGVNNLMSVITTTGKSIIYNGRQLKAKNLRAFKEISHLQANLSKCNKNTKTSNKLRSLHNQRLNLIIDLLHKASSHFIKIMKQEGISVVVVGHNKGWKNGSNLPKLTAQTFQAIPFTILINMLKYKCELNGIICIEHEESYTSKCDALALEYIGKHEKYKGKRVKRGLYLSSVGKLINADINGAINILRKVVGDELMRSILVDRGLTLNPTMLYDLYSLNKYNL